MEISGKLVIRWDIRRPQSLFSTPSRTPAFHSSNTSLLKHFTNSSAPWEPGLVIMLPFKFVDANAPVRTSKTSESRYSHTESSCSALLRWFCQNLISDMCFILFLSRVSWSSGRMSLARFSAEEDVEKDVGERFEPKEGGVACVSTSIYLQSQEK